MTRARAKVPASAMDGMTRHDASSRGDVMIRCRLSTLLLLIVLAALGLAMVVEYLQAPRRMSALKDRQAADGQWWRNFIEEESFLEKKTAATCREVLKIEPSLWTFATAEDVEPTNNAAERALRHAVCWRKTSFGTDSAAGSRFVERILTAVESWRRQGRDLLDFLVAAVSAHRSGGKPSSLLPAGA
ncbi:hypothetical protein HK102_010100 [Quaeritorhiza haematococci]|nr:hypothetical protein HK102_010100 [Quaeritorhiza haematococci]